MMKVWDAYGPDITALRCLEKVGHANLKICYDAGNIIYYTGKVDFKALFAKLKSAGFNGPIMVEGVKRRRHRKLPSPIRWEKGWG